MRRFDPQALLGSLNDVEERNAPDALYVEGDVELARATRRVAVVGSRDASELGLRRATRLASALVREGIVIVSGLAEGIDTAAHRSAIRSGGRTIGVIGTPIDRSYPPSNVELQREIARDHLLLSQFAPGAPVQRRNFVLRNRTMALVAHASVIVEAGESSGSLSQGWEALRLGRPLFLMRSIVENNALEWPAEMLDHGARVLSDPEELFPYLPSTRWHAHEDAPF